MCTLTYERMHLLLVSWLLHRFQCCSKITYGKAEGGRLVLCTRWHLQIWVGRLPSVLSPALALDSNPNIILKRNIQIPIFFNQYLANEKGNGESTHGQAQLQAGYRGKKHLLHLQHNFGKTQQQNSDDVLCLRVQKNPQTASGPERTPQELKKTKKRHGMCVFILSVNCAARV